jgi:hypothetical protein
VQLLLEEFGKYAAGRQAYFTNIYNQVRPWQQWHCFELCGPRFPGVAASWLCAHVDALYISMTRDARQFCSHVGGGERSEWQAAEGLRILAVV